MLGLANPDMLATTMASAGIGPEVMAPQLGLGGLINPAQAMAGTGQLPMPAAAAEMAASRPGVIPPTGNTATQLASAGQGGDIFSRFMSSVKGGINNPNALAAVAATGQRESGFSSGNAFRSWDDVGKPAGGIMSWRDDRLNNLLQYAKVDDISKTTPEQQGQFFLDEAAKSGLLDRLNAAGSPEEAMREMNRAWAFKGFDNPDHPETQARLQAANEMAPLVGSLGGPQGGAGSTIDFARAGGSMATPAISPGGTDTQQQATANFMPTPPGGGFSAGGNANAGIGGGSQAAAVLNGGQPPAAGGQTQTLGSRLAALGKGMGEQKAFQPQKQDMLQPTGAAPQIGAFRPDPNSIAQLMALLGGASGQAGAAVPSLAAMIQPRR